METKEKLDRKLEKIECRIIEKLRSIRNFDDENEVRRFSKEFNINSNLTEELFYIIKSYKKDRKDYQILKYISKNGTSKLDLNEDLMNKREKIKNSENAYKEAVKEAKFESFIGEIPSKNVGRSVIEYLKENGANENIIKNAVDKYASEMKFDLLKNENVLKFLYDNNYEANNDNPINVVYKYYCKCRSKDQVIENLEQEIEEIEGVIHKNINTIKTLNKKLSYYEQIVPSMQAQIKEYAEKAKNSVYSVKELKRQAELKERKGLFKVFFRKIKFFFMKDKPLLLSASLSGIQSDMSAVTNGLVKVGNSLDAERGEM